MKTNNYKINGFRLCKWNTKMRGYFKLSNVEYIFNFEATLSLHILAMEFHLHRWKILYTGDLCFTKLMDYCHHHHHHHHHHFNSTDLTGLKPLDVEHVVHILWF
jgi:hypothetical protein